MMTTTSKLIYALAFQVGWFICILAGSWISLAYTLAFLGVHLTLTAIKSSAISAQKELQWLALITICGLTVETISFSVGFLYSQQPFTLLQFLSLPPLWLVNLWVLFGIALSTCLSFLFSNAKLTYLMTCLCIPLNYYAGAELNSEVDVNAPLPVSLALITLLWLAFLGFAIYVKKHYFQDNIHAN